MGNSSRLCSSTNWIETSITAWNDVISGRTTIINTQDFIAGKLVTNGYTLQKSNVILGLILVVFLMK